MALFKSRPETLQRLSPLRPQQEQLFNQQFGALAGPGAGGAFGDIADYFRNLLSGGGAGEFEAPLMRQFQEDILPGIAEQFAGLGAGGLSSGGFAQETGRAGTDLAERLGAMRAGLRQQGAQGLLGLAQGALSPVDELLVRPRQPSLFETFLGAAGGGLGQSLGVPAAQGLTSLGSQANKLFGNFLRK